MVEINSPNPNNTNITIINLITTVGYLRAQSVLNSCD